MIETGACFPAFRRARLWREHAWRLLQEHIAYETFADGTHCENSIAYAAGVINDYFLAVRQVRRLGLKIPETFRKKLRSMYLWAVKILPPTGNLVPLGDGGIGAGGRLVKATIVKGALEFADPTLKWFARMYPEEVKRTASENFDDPARVLAKYDKVKEKKPPFTSILLPDAGWAVMRTSWERNALYMFVDLGRDEAWHSHPDFGTFCLWAFGRPLVMEAGRTGPYEADLSKRWYKQTIAHNTVMVDSRSMRKCTDTRVDQWWTGPGCDYAEGTSDGYRWIGVLHNRRVLFVKPDYWIVSDFLPGPSYYGATFQASGYHEFDWLAHFQPTKLLIDRKAKRIHTTYEKANVVLVPLNKPDVEIREFEGPVSTPDGFAEAPYISLHREGLAFVQFQVLLERAHFVPGQQAARQVLHRLRVQRRKIHRR